ncbi:MAG: 16S rRNA (cytosine(1402)-N(4))-methyltransferase RsmH [Desulfobacterales bacterium]|nr:16S rRNA (cytosine(1402)-N(4))-methyltransferase RsmH [Desulfobacterales bacterium]
MPYRHIPVMPAEVLHYLDCRPGTIHVDGTLGGAGHAVMVLEKIMPGGLLIGIDQDRDAIQNAETVLGDHAADVRLFQGNFVRLPDFLSQLNIAGVDSILLDLGISLYQIESSGRGFSFMTDEPLDMRMDVTARTKAEDIINGAEEKNLRKIFQEYGEERWARQIARNIVAGRKEKKITSSRQLAEIVKSAVPRKASLSQRIHPATRVFMALRIAVNQELEVLASFLDGAMDFLNPKGRLCIISFHSLEDRIVKHRFKAMEKGCSCPPRFPQCVCGRTKLVRSLTPKVVRPTDAEVRKNPMARSARLRAFEKL